MADTHAAPSAGQLWTGLTVDAGMPINHKLPDDAPREEQTFPRSAYLDTLLAELDATWDGTTLPERDLTRAAINPDNEERF